MSESTIHNKLQEMELVTKRMPELASIAKIMLTGALIANSNIHDPETTPSCEESMQDRSIPTGYAHYTKQPETVLFTVAKATANKLMYMLKEERKTPKWGLPPPSVSFENNYNCDTQVMCSVMLNAADNVSNCWNRQTLLLCVSNAIAHVVADTIVITDNNNEQLEMGGMNYSYYECDGIFEGHGYTKKDYRDRGAKNDCLSHKYVSPERRESLWFYSI
uniref:Uncharacterized protein n=1 Tax=viral metagenome TaxID=1070528 RepID=A0A6C0J5A7_9ZZZZ